MDEDVENQVKQEKNAMEPIIRVEHLCKTFDVRDNTVHAAKDISFDIERGDIFGIIGLFCVVLYFLGFYIGALLFIPALMYLMEVRSVKKIALTTIITLAAVYILFGMLLNISLPAPIFMR